MARHHIKDHRAKQLLVVPNDDKFVAVAAPEAFSRHSGTCMILGGQVGRDNSQNAAFHVVTQFVLEFWLVLPSCLLCGGGGGGAFVLICRLP